MKKIFIVSLLIISFWIVTPQVFAQNQSGFTALAPIPGLTDQSATSVINSTSLANFFNNLYKYLIGLAAALAVVQIIWAGIEIALNKENISSITEEKGKIRNALYGLLLVLSPALVFSIINPSILNLSLDLPELKTMTKVAAPTIVQDPTSVILSAIKNANAAGCSVVNSDPANIATTLTTVSCPYSGAGKDAASAFANACPSPGRSTVRFNLGSDSQGTCDMTPVK